MANRYFKGTTEEGYRVYYVPCVKKFEFTRLDELGNEESFKFAKEWKEPSHGQQRKYDTGTTTACKPKTTMAEEHVREQKGQAKRSLWV